VEQTAVPGAIYTVKVVEPGNNYSNNTTATITGDGSGATAQVILLDGKVHKIVMLTYGSGYTYANITIADPGRITGPSTVDATAYAILPPARGHGFDATKELYTDSICIYSSIRGETELYLINQDYRQYGIIKNPVDVETKRKIAVDSAIIAFNVDVESTQNILVDSILINNNVKYRVVGKTSTSILIQQISSIYRTPSGTLVSESNPSNTYYIKNVSKITTIDKYSGNLMYTDNSIPIIPSEQQSVVVKTFIKL
jgi:hypothetical protein